MSSVAENRAKERQLTRIATRGVTQLFNAVAERQKLVDKKLEELQKTKERSKQRKVVDEIKSNDFHANLHSKLRPAVCSFL
jgi:DNA topoisomerase VI subunit B